MKLPSALGLLCTAFAVLLVILSHLHEQREWARFVAENDCKVIGRTKRENFKPQQDVWFCEGTQKEYVR